MFTCRFFIRYDVRQEAAWGFARCSKDFKLPYVPLIGQQLIGVCGVIDGLEVTRVDYHLDINVFDIYLGFGFHSDSYEALSNDLPSNTDWTWDLDEIDTDDTELSWQDALSFAVMTGDRAYDVNGVAHWVKMDEDDDDGPSLECDENFTPFDPDLEPYSVNRDESCGNLC